jgi:hypothetical protein
MPIIEIDLTDEIKAWERLQPKRHRSTIKPGKPKKISAKELDTLLFNDWTGDILPDWYTRLPHHSPSEPVWRKIPRELYFAVESLELPNWRTQVFPKELIKIKS